MSEGIEGSAPVAAPEGSPGAPPAAAPPPGEPVSPRLAALMRKEAQATKSLREAKAERDKFAQEKAAWQEERARYGEFDKRWQENPLEALKSRGVNFDDLTKIALNQGQMTPELQLRAEARAQQERIVALEKQLEDRFSKLHENEEQRAKAEVEAHETTMRNDIKAELTAAADRFPLTNLFARDDLVYNIIDSHFEKTKEVLDFEKAAERAEKMLLDEALKAKPILDKVRPTSAPANPQQESLIEKARAFASGSQSWVERTPKTLSNSLPNPAPSAPRRVLSDDERVANALAKLRAARG